MFSPVEINRRLTFDRNGQPEHALSSEQVYSRNPLQQMLLSKDDLASVESGLERLTRALTPRLERYKVELFIHLCEMLDD